MLPFYEDLSKWVQSINERSQTLNPYMFAKYIMDSGDALSKKYNRNKLVVDVVQVHINFMVDKIDGNLPF